MALWLSSLLPGANAAELKPETLKAWNESVETARRQMQERLCADQTFLWIDEVPNRHRQVKAGEILVLPVGHNPRKVPSGLIHHWMGAAFLPNAKLDEVFAVVRDYAAYKEFYKPAVIDSTAISQAGGVDVFSMILMNKYLVMKQALDSEYQTSYFRVDEKRWYSVSYSTRVREIQDFGQPGERELAADEGSGYIWRLFSIARFEEADGGVYVEIEAMALSRGIPASLAWMVDSVVRRVSRDSLGTFLRQTSDRVSTLCSRMSSLR